MKKSRIAVLAFVAALAAAGTVQAEDVTLNVAMVNNAPFVVLEELSSKFTEDTGINLEFTVLSENEVRAKIQEDVGLGGGNFDLVTLGTSDMGTYLTSGWTRNLDEMFEGLDEETAAWYDKDDIFPGVLDSNKDAASGALAALPFYSESTMVCYRTDVFEALGLEMPEQPTWDDILELAKAADGYVDEDGNELVGIAIRGKAGYGENMYIFGSIMNSFGGKYYDMDWNCAYDSEEVRNAWEYYKELLSYAEDSPTTCGYTECLNLFTQGAAAIYYDATVSAATFESEESAVAGKVGYGPAPSEVAALSSTIGGWGIAVTSGSKHPDEAFQFLLWATSKDYHEICAEAKGWANVPSATRASLYEREEYTSVAPFAIKTAASLENANPNHPCVDDVPYTGASLPNLPEYSSWGTTLAEQMSAYIADSTDLDSAIKACCAAIDEAAEEGGYRD